jgi:hypothetical protein
MSDDESKIERLDDNLNSRTRYKAPEDTRSTVRPDEDEPAVGDKWRGPELDELLGSERVKRDMHPIVKKIFFIALTFFLLAAGTAGYIYFGGGNFVSSKNVDINVTGPVTISAGDVLNLGITVTNTNNADLETTNLSITYPDGTRDPLDSTEPLTIQKSSLGVIASGQQVATSTSAIIFGEKGDTKDITITLEYEIKGSNATFSKQKVYEISIGTIPLTMTVSEPSTVTSGTTFATTINVVSNSTSVIKGVLVQAEYPYGFAVTSSAPTALNQDGNLWNLGDMAPGDSKTITIDGSLSGQDTEQRTFRFSAGVGSADAPTRFDTSLVSASETLSINRPDIGFSLSLGGDNSDPYVAPLGQIIAGSVSYKNNMTQKLENAQVVVNLSGQALDKFSVTAQNGGFYDSTKNQIIWNSTSNPALTSLSPGDAGVFSFQFASLPSQAGALTTQNQEINLSASLNGTGQDQSPISSSDTRTVRLASEVDLSANPIYSTGAFKNTGPIPPEAGKQTTYTIVLSAKDTQNDITNPVVTAVLGPGVTWVGVASAPSESVSYDDTSRTITWNLSTLASGTGFNSPARQVAVQVSITPSTGQVGSIPVLLNNIGLTGTDSFTSTPVSVSAPAVTTKISTDPQYVQGDETVVK